MKDVEYKCRTKTKPQWCNIVSCGACPYGEILENMEDIPDNIQDEMNKHFWDN